MAGRIASPDADEYPFLTHANDGSPLSICVAARNEFVLLHELLAAVDVVCRAGERGVDHNMNS